MKKKILVINIGTEIGGIEKSLINFLRYLETRNCDVDLIFWKPAGPMFQYIPNSMHILNRLGPGSIKEIIKCNSIKVIPKLFYYAVYRIGKQLGREWKMVSKIQKKYDVAISYCQNGLSPYFTIDKVKADKKYMFYHHGSYEKTRKEEHLDRIYYPKFSKIIAVSESSRKMLLSVFPELEEKIISIHNLVDTDNILNKSKADIDCFSNRNAIKICTVGRLSEEKGQLFSLEVAKKLEEKNAEFEWIFVGDGPTKEACDNFVIQNSLQHKCKLIGEKNNPYPYIRQADVYVQTSYIEADPITIQEAKVLDKLIVASDIEAVRESLKGYQKGDVCEFDDEKFAEKILEILQNKIEIKRENILINLETIQKFDNLFF